MFKKFFRRAVLKATIAAVLLTLPATIPPAIAQASAAAPGTLYGVTRSQDLVTIDPATGAFTTLSNLFLAGAEDSQASELASNPAAGRLYADRLSFVNTKSGSTGSRSQTRRQTSGASSSISQQARFSGSTA